MIFSRSRAISQTISGIIVYLVLSYLALLIFKLFAQPKLEPYFLIAFSPLLMSLSYLIAKKAINIFKPLAKVTSGLKKVHEGTARTSLTLDEIIDNMEEGVMLLESKGYIVNANSCICNLMGVAKEEVIGSTLDEFIEIPLILKVRNYIEEFPELGDKSDMSFDQTIKDVQAIVHIQPIKDRWFLVTVSDITELMKAKNEAEEMNYIMVRALELEKEMSLELEKAREEAEKANRLKSEFLANISHEIRTPLSAIVGIAELALEDEQDPKQMEYLKIIKESSDLLIAILNDILDLSKIEANKLELENTRFSLHKVVDGTIQTLKTKATAKGIDISFHISPDVPDALVGDPMRLKQVLMNLVGNAIKFTEKGGVFIDVQKLSQSEDNVLLHFMVKDTGIGIPEEKRKVIFDAFSQVDTSTARKYGGTGLGLTISSRLVEMFGGNIWVDSQVGVGSTFHFTVNLKLCKAEQMSQEADNKQPILKSSEIDGAKREGFILVVEDNPINQKLISKILNKYGYKFVIANNGFEALSLLKERSFDLIFMDVQMPVMDGFAVTSAIREMEAEKCIHTPIIAVTAYAMNGDREKCINAGMDDYIAKPFNHKKVVEIIENYLSKRPSDAQSDLQAHIQESDDVLDLEGALARVDNDVELLKELMSIFIDDFRSKLTNINNLLEQDDLKSLEQIFHTIKGTAGNLGAFKVAEIAMDLEEACRNHNVEVIRASLKPLESAVSLALERFEQLIKKLESNPSGDVNQMV